MTLPSDPFALLGLPRNFGLAEADISAAYWSRLPELHPDLSTHSDSDDLAAALNSAREILSRPLSRAEALLHVLAPNLPKDNSLPPGYLAWVMGKHEEMDEELAAADGPAPAARWKQWINEQSATHEARLASLFQSTPPDLKSLQMEINCLRYIERFRSSLAGEGSL